MNHMRLLPFTPAASQCAMSDLGMQIASRLPEPVPGPAG